MGNLIELRDKPESGAEKPIQNEGDCRILLQLRSGSPCDIIQPELDNRTRSESSTKLSSTQ